MNFEINEIGTPNIGPKSVRYGLNIVLPIEDVKFDSLDKPEIKIQQKEELESKGIRFDDCGKLTCISQEEDKFVQNHFNLVNNNLCIFVPDNINLEIPIVLDELSTGNVGNNLTIHIGKNSKVKILDKARGNPKYRSQIVDLIIEESSEVEYITLQNLESGTNHSIKRGTTEKNSILNWIDINLGGNFVKTEVSTFLKGEGSKTVHKSLFFGDKNQILDMYSRSIHGNAHTFSDMVTKGAVKDKSKALYRGLVKIKENAPHSEGYQKEDTLILDETAEADSIPELEIDNNEVKCSHGASVGKVNEESIFYLMSRGLSRADAKRKVVEGFFFPVIDDLDENVKNEIIKIIDQKYETYVEK